MATAGFESLGTIAESENCAPKQIATKMFEATPPFLLLSDWLFIKPNLTILFVAPMDQGHLVQEHSWSFVDLQRAFAVCYL